MTPAIVAPMCAYTAWVFVLWWVLGGVRGWAWLRDTMPAEYFRVGQGKRPPDKVVDVHHHFSNQFEIPVLFYLGCLAAIATESVDGASVTLAWSFVGLRVVHTAIVLIRNDPRIRVAPYVLSTLSVWGIWANLFHNVVWAAA